ncbi:MAG: T9SS type A sorting domain-containing protein [Bacteroidetes bacterium]|nr:T9SS type A sorting domain-containing protein [Bacteroidota bacterium]
MKTLKSLSLFLFLPLLVSAQTTGLKIDFNDGNLTGWESPNSATYSLSNDGGTLKLIYTRGASSTEWDNFNYLPASAISVTENPKFSVRIKSTVNTQFTVKPVYSTGDNFLTKPVTGDNLWHQYNFTFAPSGNGEASRFYFYLDAGTTAATSGTVWLDDILIGDSAAVALGFDYSAFDLAISFAEKLLASTKVGSGEGEFPQGARTELESVVTTAKANRLAGFKKQSEIDGAQWNLSDACVTYETLANLQGVFLSDKKTTGLTRNLYRNLAGMKNNGLLFGMHDATGYGVGWKNNNDRSDIKDIVGDYPAVFSEDVNTIQMSGDVAGQTYRLSSAYERGSVITMVWHQVDPKGRGFYGSDVAGENVVATILPGGEFHDQYKNTLKKVARFFKGFRGSDGKNIPVIFRPFHEHFSDAFWWGQPFCTPAQYNQIWQFTFNYLTDSLNVHNLIWAVSPLFYQVNTGNKYFDIYPGDDYVDIFGTDQYFGDTVTDETKLYFLNGLKVIAGHARDRNKLCAVTEIGQEGLDTQDWFTGTLLPPFKTDSLAGTFVYAAVWRNESITHHYAPYPGHKTVPDFQKFYDDPYTLFTQDLPDMYAAPEPDFKAPAILMSVDSVLVTGFKTVLFTVKTDERAFLRISQTDLPYDQMSTDFEKGEGSFIHTTTLSGIHGSTHTYYIRTRDVAGNKSAASWKLMVTVDTLLAPVTWSDVIYPISTWKTGKAPLGISAGSVTKIEPVKTAYFRHKINLAAKPKEFAILAKGTGGVILFVNGKEVKRNNLPADVPPGYDLVPGSNAVYSKSFILDAQSLGYLKPGENVIGMEVHALSPATVDQVDARFFTATSTVLALGADGWEYFDQGAEPEVKKLGEIVSVENETGLPERFVLYPAYPNPFNPSTTIRYSLPSASELKVEVFNLLGSSVAVLEAGKKAAGYHEIKFDATGFASGIYLIKITAGNQSTSQKVVLVK